MSAASGQRRRGWQLAVALATLLVPVPLQRAVAQPTDGLSTQLWLDYNPSWAIGAKTDFFGDLGARTALELSDFWRFVVRPSVRYHPSRSVTVAGGLGSFYTRNDVIADRWEIRPWQGVTVRWPRRRVSLEHYLRLEQLFDFNTRTGESRNSVRGRYRLLAFMDVGARRPGRFWRLMGSVEGFLTLGGDQGQSREQFRLTAGLERSYRQGLRTGFEATWQKEGSLFGEGSLDELFLRVRLYTSFGS